LVKIEKIKGNDQIYNITFSYQPLTAGLHNVFLAGAFNDFSANNDKFFEENGIYYYTLQLPKGKYNYKFIVDGNWITDIDSEEIHADGYGGHNSVLYVGSKEELHSLRLVEFSFRSDQEIETIFLAGSFNNWSVDQDPMRRSADGIYRLIVPLNSGKHQYKFVVDGEWISDDEALEFEINHLNKRNSAVTVDERFPLLEKARGAGILTYRIRRNTLTDHCNLISKNQIRFRTTAYKNNCTNIFLMLDEKKIPLDMITSNHNYDYYQKDLDWQGEDFSFCFLYINVNEELYLNREGFRETGEPLSNFHFNAKEFEPFFTPDWVKEGIIYQIFTDRFCNGDPQKNQDFSEWYYEDLTDPLINGKKLQPDQACYNFVKDWNDHTGLQQSPYHARGIADNFSFYGGDITGIKQKLSYLSDLGVTIIYLNPIFEARSNHKYDCSDYKKIDPHFGTAEEFKELVSDCHKAGIRIILDVAFNHTGDTFWAFQDAVKKGPESAYYSWYEWKKWPLPPQKENFIPSEYYNCWWGLGHMPDLDYDLSRLSPEENPVRDITKADPNKDVVNYILEVAEYWLSDMDIDGFRLDVPNEVPFWFWKLFRNKVKSLKPDAYLVGEIWHNAEEWVGNDYFDAVMNYACFKDPVLLFFNLRKCSAVDFDKALKPGLMNYPLQAVQVMMNLLDSHDTFRFLEIAHGDIAKLKLAVIFQMTYPGTPHIWYGDEIGMKGAHDPDCRRPFNWNYSQNEESVNLRKFYKNIISIRKEHPVLIYGDFTTLIAEGMIYAFRRELKDQQIITIFNNDDHKRRIVIKVSKDAEFIELLTGKKYLTEAGQISIELNKYNGAILLRNDL